MSISINIRRNLGTFNLDIGFEAGNEVIALCGPSGSGKSLTLRAIAGIDEPDEGHISIDDLTVYDSAENINVPTKERHVGYMFQHYALFPSMTLRENIYAGTIRIKDKATRNKLTDDVIKRFGLEKREGVYPSNLSGGEQQRVALARMIVSEPRILLLDEPFSALDAELKKELYQEMKDIIRDFGKTVILVSHDYNEVREFASRVIRINNGKLELNDEPVEVLREPEPDSDDTLNWQIARKMMTDLVLPVDTETIPLENAYRRVLAGETEARMSVPPFDRSPYDGYAVRAADTAGASSENPCQLKVTFNIAAGDRPVAGIGAGEAVRIMTGAPIPEGADAVIMYEKTSWTDDSVEIYEELSAGMNIIRRGEDVAEGQVLFDGGEILDSGVMGVLASQGYGDVSVYRRPRIGIISTGSEVVEPGNELPDGSIYDSNRFLLIGELEKIGCVPVCIATCRDTVEGIQEALNTALDTCDGVIMTGGVSVGDYDLTPKAIDAAGGTRLIDRMNIKPGMACCYAHRDGKLICALSGNPASAILNYALVTKPALLKLCGRSKYVPEKFTVRMGQSFGKKSVMTRFLRGRIEIQNGEAVFLQGGGYSKDQSNGVVSSLAGCNAMAIIPAGTGKVPAGTKLEAIEI